jgi:ABC-type transport system substrate-binding protein
MRTNGKMTRRELLKSAGLAAAAGSMTWTWPARARAATAKKDLIFVEGTDITVLDPMMVTDTPSNAPNLLVYDGLVAFDKDMQIVPVLATKWTISPDQKSWTFSLRPNVKFSNGAPFNAKSVQFVFERMTDQATASPARSQYVAVDRVETPDDLTVRFVTKYPFPDLLRNLAQPNFLAYDPAHTKKYSVKDYARNPIGTGPFMLKEWVSGDRVVFVRNPNYWGPAPRVDSITYKPVPEGAARAAMLRTGEADIAVKIPPEEIANLERDPGVSLLKLDSMYQISYELNNTMDNPPLSKKLVRQALNYAVDKEAIVKTILMGLGAPMVSPFGPGINFRATFEPYRYDPARAKKMLADAGYPNGFKLTLNSPNGRYMKDREVTEAVQGYLRAVGIQAEVKVWEWSPYLVMIQKDEKREAFMVGRATPSADFTATRLFSKGAIGLYNVSGFWREKVEELLVKARSSFDEKERTEGYRQIQAIVWEEAPWIFLHNQKAVVGLRKGIEGYAMLTTEVSLLANVSKQ